MIISCALVLLNPPCHEIATEHSLSMENNIKNNRGSPHDSLPLRMEEVMSNHTMIHSILLLHGEWGPSNHCY